MEGEIKHLTSICLWVLSSLCYCYFISSRLPKGKYRFLSLLPIFYLFTILPLSLSHLLPTAITTFFISWLGNFKLLLFSFDKGPLSMDPPKSLPLFIAIGSLPIIIKKNTNTKTNPYPQHSQTSTNLLKKLSLYYAFEIMLLATFLTLWPDVKDYVLIYPAATVALYSCGLFIVLDLVMASAHAMVRALFMGLVELEAPSNKPYFSTSLQDFWGRRWNLTAMNILRITVFQPVRVATSNLLGNNRAIMLGYFSTFLVSGLMHELLMYNLTRRAPTGEMTRFFVLHGVCVIGEIIVKRALMFRLPEFVSRSLTLGFVIVTGYWMFFSPIFRNSLEVKLIEELTGVLDFIKRMVNMII